MLSSTDRGTAFEKTIQALLEQQIKEGTFFARPEWSRVFHKKGYYSHARGTDIIFDVSVEVTAPGESRPSLIVLVECKDYTSAVPVSDLEEFDSKVRQVAGTNVKAVFASTARFQSGAFHFAEKSGFGLLRYLGRGNAKWELRRSASWSGGEVGEAREVEAALTHTSPVSQYFDSCFFAAGNYSYSANRMFGWLCLGGGSDASEEFIRLMNPTPKAPGAVPFIEKRDIEQLASAHVGDQSSVVTAIDLRAVCASLSDSHGLTVEIHPPSGSVLGSLSFSPMKIRIFTADAEAPRSRFTLAHELAHLLLDHGRVIDAETTEAVDLFPASYARLEFTDLRRMEWQANFLASCLLLPLTPFVFHVMRLANLLELRDRGYGLIYVDNQPVNLDILARVTRDLAVRFRVSRQAVEIRLAGLGLLNDDRGSAFERFQLSWMR